MLAMLLKNLFMTSAAGSSLLGRTVRLNKAKIERRYCATCLHREVKDKQQT